VAASYLSHIRKTKNKVKEHHASEFHCGIQGLKGEDKLAEELSCCEYKASEEL